MRSFYAGMGKRKPTPRTVRRMQGRVHESLVKDLERLARLAPGGAPDRPLDVQTPSQVEPIAEASTCPLCEGVLRIENHAAETHETGRLRVAHMRCTSCGVARAFYFRLTGSALN